MKRGITLNIFHNSEPNMSKIKAIDKLRKTTIVAPRKIERILVKAKMSVIS